MENINKVRVILALTIYPSASFAEDFTIYVAPKASPAYEFAQSQAENDGVLGAERRIHKAFKTASEKLNECTGCNVEVKISAGIFQGKGKTGTWSFPDTKSPESTLRVIGGYDDTFSTRKPFETPTYLQIGQDRSQPVLSFEGKKHALKALEISGFVFDTGPSNAYDAKTNSLLKSSSSTWPILSLGYLTTDHLVIADNVFMNAPHGVGGPRVRAMSAESKVDIENNLFYNNVFTWSVNSGGGKHQVEHYLFKGNSFILNWPYNPDKSTSNPGVVELGNKDIAALVSFENNMFTYNTAGAIFPQWDDTRGPNISIQNNLFYKNGGLFDPTSEADGAIVGKFNGAAKHSIFDMDDVEDDFEWEVEDNISIDPIMEINVLKLQSVVYADLLRNSQPAKSLFAATNEDSHSINEFDALNAELEALMGDALGEEVDSIEETIALDEMSEVVIDQMDETSLDKASDESDSDTSLFGDLLEENNVLEVDGSILNYAPYVSFSPGSVPLPQNGDATGFGISPERVRNYE